MKSKNHYIKVEVKRATSFLPFVVKKDDSIVKKIVQIVIPILTLLIAIFSFLFTIKINEAANKIAQQANEQTEKSLPIKYKVELPNNISFTVNLNNNQPLDANIDIVTTQGYIKDIVLIENDKKGGFSVRTLDSSSMHRSQNGLSFSGNMCKFFSTKLNSDKTYYTYCFFYIIGGDGTQYIDCAYLKNSEVNNVFSRESVKVLRKIDLLSSNSDQDTALQDMKNHYKVIIEQISNLPGKEFEN